MPYSNRPGFSYPLFFGLVSILFSFGKGLCWFAPGLLLPIPDRMAIDERLRGVSSLLMWFLIGLILVYAKWWAWYGGWFWGPRFFLIASVPASLAIAFRLRNLPHASWPALSALVVVLTLSAWVAADGALFDQRDLDMCLANAYALEFACWYVPEFSVLWRPFVTSAVPAMSQMVLAGYFVIVYAWLVTPVAAEATRRFASITKRGRR
jgi:hypothetical protein